jgi:hypothetical protein
MIVELISEYRDEFGVEPMDWDTILLTSTQDLLVKAAQSWGTVDHVACPRPSGAHEALPALFDPLPPPW